jgi:hypothetical protein
MVITEQSAGQNGSDAARKAPASAPELAGEHALGQKASGQPVPDVAVQASALNASGLSWRDAGIGRVTALLAMLLALVAMQARRVRLWHAHS